MFLFFSEPAESKHENTPEPAGFPSFKSFFDNDNIPPFDFTHPPAVLTPERFTINESPRNFPQEAAQRLRKKLENEDSSAGKSNADDSENGVKRRLRRAIPTSYSYGNSFVIT